MESGEWRYGQSADTPEGERPAAEPDRPSAPNLWAEDTDSWSTTSSWLPAPQDSESTLCPAPQPYPAPQPARPAEETTNATPWPSQPQQPQPQPPTNPTLPAATWGEPAWDAAPTATHATPRPQSTAGSSWGQPPATSLEPAGAGSGWGFATHAPLSTPLPLLPPGTEVAEVTPAMALSPVSPARTGPSRPTGIDAWSRTDSRAGRRSAGQEEFGKRRGDPYSEKPAYGPVLGYTAGWYGIPAVLYLCGSSRWIATGSPSPVESSSQPAVAFRRYRAVAGGRRPAAVGDRRLARVDSELRGGCHRRRRHDDRALSHDVKQRSAAQ